MHQLVNKRLCCDVVKFTQFNPYQILLKSVDWLPSYGHLKTDERTDRYGEVKMLIFATFIYERSGVLICLRVWAPGRDDNMREGR